MTRLALAALCAVALVLAACGGEPEDPPAIGQPPTDEPEDPDPADDPPEDPAPEQPPVDDAPEDTHGPVPVVTEDHDGETIAMPQDGSVVIQLSGGWLWDYPNVDGSSIDLAQVDYLVDPGYQEWEVYVLAPGVTTVTAHGEPNCANRSQCPPRDVELRFEVVG